MTGRGGRQVRRPRRPATMIAAVRQTAAALDLGPAFAAHQHAAELLAETIDAMPDAERGKMLGQTIPPLLKVLEMLTAAAGSDIDEPIRTRGLTADELQAFLNEMGVRDARARTGRVSRGDHDPGEPDPR